MIDIKQPAYDLDLEKNLLGAVIICQKGFDKVGHILNENLFYDNKHRVIWNALCELVQRNTPIDIITLHDQLRRTARVTEAGGMAYVAGITIVVCSDANLEYWAVVLAQLFMERELYKIGVNITREEEGDIFDTFTKYEKELQSLQSNFTMSGSVSLADACKEILSGLNSELSGVPSGFRDIQEFMPGGIYILAARPGMGKTTLAMNMAFKQAEKGIPAGIFSMEMPRKLLISRSLAAYCNINSHKLVHPHMMTDWEKGVFQQSMSKLKTWPLTIVDGALSLDKFKIEAKRMVARDGVKIIYIDYLQLMQGGKKSDKRNESRNDELGRICDTLKNLAIELNIPIVEMSQLSRAGEKDKDNKPKLHNLRDSGNIEQAADTVYMLYREDYYADTETGECEFIVAKNRYGPLGTIGLRFDAKHSKFEDA